MKKTYGFGDIRDVGGKAICFCRDTKQQNLAIQYARLYIKRRWVLKYPIELGGIL